MSPPAPSSFEAVLSSLLDVAVGAFAITSMLSVGVGHRLRDLLAPLRDGRAFLRALAANYVLVPLLALALTRIVGLPPALRDGLVLVSMAAGAPFLIKLTEQADRGTLGLGTAQRNIAAATVVADEAFGDRRTLVMVVVSSIVGLALLFPAAAALRRSAARHPVPVRR